MIIDTPRPRLPQGVQFLDEEFAKLPAGRAWKILETPGTPLIIRIAVRGVSRIYRHSEREGFVKVVEGVEKFVLFERHLEEAVDEFLAFAFRRANQQRFRKSRPNFLKRFVSAVENRVSKPRKSTYNRQSRLF